MPQKKKPKKKRCLTCRNEAKRGNYCRTCESRKYREKNKERACYQNLKDNVKRRNKTRKSPIPFEITFEEFKDLCLQTDYIAGKGRTKDSFSLDRKENDKGYTKSNLQKLTVSENSRKHTKVLHYDYLTRSAYVVGKNCNINIDLGDNEFPF